VKCVARNSQCFLGGDLGAEPSSPVTIGGLRLKLPALGDFCNFSIKITYFMHVSAKIVIITKAITHQLKAFEKQSNRTT